MYFVNEDEFKLTEDISSIERRICRFYLRVIKDYFDLDENFDPIYMNSSYRKKQSREKRIELLLLCIQDTCLGLRKFYASLINYKEIAKYLSQKTLIRICCVQDGSLLSALGICIAIDEAVGKYRLTGKTDIKQIQLVVIKKEQNWRNLCSYIVERVNSCYKNVEIKLQLINERSDRLSVEVFRTLREADIVVMARYLSQFHCLTAKTHFLEAVLKRMKELSILFYLDTYHKTYENTLKRLFSKWDFLIELRSKKAVYAPFEDPRNKKFFLEFPFLFTITFKDVMYSTCVRCSRINYNICAGKYVKDDVSLLRYSRKAMKLKISERFEKENSLPLSLKNTSEANTLQGKSLIKPRSKHGVSKHSKHVNEFPLSTRLRYKVIINGESRGANDMNTRPFKASKNVEKLIIFNIKNNDKYFKIEQGSNTEIIKTSKYPGKVIITNAQKKSKYSKVNKPNMEIVEKSDGDDKLVATNAQNKDKHSTINSPNAGIVKARNVCGNTVNTSVQNKSEHSKINKPNAEIAKSRKYLKKLSSENLQSMNEYKYPYLSTKESVTRYARYLAEIYYSKHFDRKKPSTRKFKSYKHLKK